MPESSIFVVHPHGADIAASLGGECEVAVRLIHASVAERVRDAEIVAVFGPLRDAEVSLLEPHLRSHLARGRAAAIMLPRELFASSTPEFVRAVAHGSLLLAQRLTGHRIRVVPAEYVPQFRFEDCDVVWSPSRSLSDRRIEDVVAYPGVLLSRASDDASVEFDYPEDPEWAEEENGPHWRFEAGRLHVVAFDALHEVQGLDRIRKICGVAARAPEVAAQRLPVADEFSAPWKFQHRSRGSWVEIPTIGDVEIPPKPMCVLKVLYEHLGEEVPRARLLRLQQFARSRDPAGSVRMAICRLRGALRGRLGDEWVQMHLVKRDIGELLSPHPV